MAGTLLQWVTAREKAMKIIGVVAMTAALVATSASAQTIGSESARAPERAYAVSDRSDTRHPTGARRNVVRGGGSFASTGAAGRSRTARGRAASNAFDGAWSVLLMGRSGACDGTYRYGVQISNGEVLNAGGAQVDLQGRVAPNGVVRVSVAAGNQEAHGAGRLSRTSGSGTWQGQGSGGTCAGTWQAERRQ
jgi:hypothetical protein